MRGLILIILFLATVGCGKETIQVIRTIDAPSTPVFVCECFNNGALVYGPASCTVAIGSHDNLGFLYYDIQQYPSGQWIKVYGQCRTR